MFFTEKEIAKIVSKILKDCDAKEKELYIPLKAGWESLGYDCVDCFQCGKPLRKNTEDVVDICATECGDLAFCRNCAFDIRREGCDTLTVSMQNSDSIIREVGTVDLIRCSKCRTKVQQYIVEGFDLEKNLHYKFKENKNVNYEEIFEKIKSKFIQ